MSTPTCPFGLINDPYPGSCGRYTDADNNQICDLSQSAAPTPVTSSPPSRSVDPILIACLFAPILLYFFTAKFKKLWNIVLLITFIITAITSLFYIFNIVNQQIYTLHLRLGAIFLSVSLCHTLWHWRYFLNHRSRLC